MDSGARRKQAPDCAGPPDSPRRGVARPHGPCCPRAPRIVARAARPGAHPTAAGPPARPAERRGAGAAAGSRRRDGPAPPCRSSPPAFPGERRPALPPPPVARAGCGRAADVRRRPKPAGPARPRCPGRGPARPAAAPHRGGAPPAPPVRAGAFWRDITRGAAGGATSPAGSGRRLPRPQGRLAGARPSPSRTSPPARASPPRLRHAPANPAPPKRAPEGSSSRRSHGHSLRCLPRTARPPDFGPIPPRYLKNAGARRLPHRSNAPVTRPWRGGSSSRSRRPWPCPRLSG